MGDIRSGGAFPASAILILAEAALWFSPGRHDAASPAVPLLRTAAPELDKSFLPKRPS